MHLLDTVLEEYIENHSSAEDDVLYTLNRETNLKAMLPQMLSGHIQGKVLKMFSEMIQPSCVLEVGTYTGYSAICLAAGLLDGGKLYSIDINDELADMAMKAISKANLSSKIELLVGNALDIIPGLDHQYDLVFIDADKVNYAKYYDLVFDQVKPGGYIIADNVLWSGRVINEQKDKDTQALDQYNKKIHNDQRVENVLLGVRDGLMIARKLK